MGEEIHLVNIAGRREEHKMLKEPVKKRRHLANEEFSWKKARAGLASGEDGNVALSLNAMKVDATKELAARKKAFA